MTAKAGTKKHSWKRIIARDTGSILYWCPKCETWKTKGEPSGTCPGRRNPRERPYVSPFYGLTRQEKDVLISAKSGGAIYRGKDMIFWTTIAKGLARKGFVKYKENAFILTSKGRTAIQELGLSNPGAAWHKEEKAHAMTGRKNWTSKTMRSYFTGKEDAHTDSIEMSKALGMPNPSSNKLFKSLLPIGLIVGLIWLINKNKAQ